MNESLFRNVVIVIRMDSNGVMVSIWLDNNENKVILINVYLLFGYIRLNIIVWNVILGYYFLSVRMEIFGIFILFGVMIGFLYN